MDRNDTVAKVQETAAAIADKVRDAKLDERAADLAALAREKVRNADLDTRASDLAARVRDTAVAEQVADRASAVADSARDVADTALDRTRDWLVDTRVGDALGVRPKRRRKPWALLTAGAVAAGVAAGLVLFKRRENQNDIDWTTSGLTEGGGVGASGADVALPLDGRVREAVGSDPRTSSMPALNINVVDGTVFVRGTVSSTVDQDALRSVIEGVEGVTDVDLQVTVNT